MKRSLILLTAFISMLAHAYDRVRIAVIDTGFDTKATWPTSILRDKGLQVPGICERYDVSEEVVPNPDDVSDSMGHGTHVAGLIASNAGNTNPCLIIIRNFPSRDPEESMKRALAKSIDLKVDMINYSGGGETYDDEECVLIKKALDAGIVIVVAAGNHKSDINQKPYWPARCDQRVISVANVGKDGQIEPSSNYTTTNVVSWQLESENGKEIESILPGGKFGKMTGTSQATAIMSGKIAERLYLIKNDRYMRLLKNRGK